MEKKSILKSAVESAIAAVIPTGATFFFLSLIYFIFPNNEIRLIPAQIDDKTIFVIIENHSQSALGPIKFSAINARNLVVISKNQFVKTSVEQEKNSNIALITIDLISPLARTTIIMNSSSVISPSDFRLIETKANTYVVHDGDISPYTPSKTFWANIVFQSFIYFIFIWGMNYLIRRSNYKIKEAGVMLEKTKDEYEIKIEQMERKIEGIRPLIDSVRSANKKYMIYTRRLYSEIEKENKFWRQIASKALTERVGSGDVLIKNLLKAAGFKQKKGLNDLDVDFLVRVLESSDEAVIDAIEENNT